MKWFEVMYLGRGNRLEMVSVKADSVCAAIAQLGVLPERVVNVYPW